jgi:hypothetical protein
MGGGEGNWGAFTARKSGCTNLLSPAMRHESTVSHMLGNATVVVADMSTCNLHPLNCVS